VLPPSPSLNKKSPNKKNEKSWLATDDRAPPSAAQSVVGRDPGHGDFHPVAWCQYYDGGKAWLTTLGHDARDFAASDSEFAGATEFQKLIVGGIKSVMGAEPFCR